MAVFFALLTLIGWGVGDLFGAITSRKLGYKTAFFWMMVFSLVVISFYIPFAGPIVNWKIFFLTTILNIFLLFVDLRFFEALEIGNASLVGAIAGSFGAVSAIIAIIFFGERINLIQTAGIILASLGIVLSSFRFEVLKTKTLNDLLPEKAIKYAIFVLFGWGIYYSVMRIPIEAIGWFWTQYSWHWLFLLLVFTGTIKKDAFKIFKDRKQLFFVILWTVSIIVGVFAYNLGISAGYTSIVAPIAASGSVLFVILTRIFFHEKLNLQQKIGIISSLVGIILISFAST